VSVYFITARETGTVKIGCARDPKDRLAKLQTASPAKLVLEATIFGSHETEIQLHARFAEQRVRGEWFKLTDEIEAVIRNATLSPSLIEVKARGARLSDEELANESIRREHEYFDEVMRWRAAHDPQPSEQAA
jgi:hypothetical protein